MNGSASEILLDGPLGSSTNSLITADYIYYSVKGKVYKRNRQTKTDDLIKTFRGQVRGMRCIKVTSDGCLYISPEGNSLAEEDRGLWRYSSNYGWKKVIDLGKIPDPVSIWAFAEVGQCEFLFAGIYTGDGTSRCATIFRSKDYGLTWQKVFEHPKARHIHQITWDPNGRSIYATIGDDFGIWKTKKIIRSRDYGNTWDEILPELPQIVSVLAINGCRLFASDCPGGARIFRSEDDVNYETVLDIPEQLYFFWMRFDEATGLMLASLVMGKQPEHHSKIFYSENLGLSWKLLYNKPGTSKTDGSSFSSNIFNSQIIIHQRVNGGLEKPIVVDLMNLKRRLSFNGRLSDLANGLLAFALLILSSPILLTSVLVLKLTSSDTAFFLQTRTGIDQKPFTIIKLRTISEKFGTRKISAVGQFIRSISVDEIPQLINIMRGEMRFVGPRPHPVELDERFRAEIPALDQRYVIKPGLTGLAQVSGCRGPINSVEEMRSRLRFDLLYVRSRSLRMNLEIVKRTIFGGFVFWESAPSKEPAEMS